MSISPLSDSTVRAIGSSLVLNDTTSLVKELIDNALDARATVISVELTSNTLDIIQVKDNGTGIGVEDRQLICKRGCTSKIRTIHDLDKLGGASLGYRGEALASIAELCEYVTVTTRVEGEKAATALKFGPAGSLLSSSLTSHPVGTTIRAQDFLKRIPVRKQTATKASSKTLGTIKKLLQAYAFARPTVRFSTKVLKGKNDKSNWIYAAHPNSTLLDAAVMIVGKEIATNCEHRIFGDPTITDLKNASTALKIDALLIRNDDSSRNCHADHFISVDGRPVNTVRGTMKEIVRLYRTYFRGASTSDTGSTNSLDPFLCMHIRCPAGTYDVNIEPAKDEVLFFDTKQVISASERLFIDFYGHLQAKAETPQVGHSRGTPAPTFDILMAKKSEITEGASTPPKKHTLNDDYKDGELSRTNLRSEVSTAKEDDVFPASLPRQVSEHKGVISKIAFDDDASKIVDQDFRSTNVSAFRDLYSLDEDDFVGLEDMPPVVDTDTDKDAGLKRTSAMNPWSIAKLTATLQPTSINPVFTNSSSDLNQPMTPNSSTHSSSHGSISPFNQQRIPLYRAPPLPTPSKSPQGLSFGQNPLPPTRRRAQLSQEAMIEGMRDFAPTSRGEIMDTKHPSDIEQPIKLARTVQLPPFQRPPDLYNKDGRFGEPAASDVRYVAVGELSSSCQASSSFSNRGAFGQSTRQPFKPPLRNPSSSVSIGVTPNSPGPSDHSLPGTKVGLLADRKIEGHAHPGPGMDVQAAHLMPPPPSRTPSFNGSQSRDEELGQIMDFEHRKKRAVKQHRQGQLKIGNSFLDPGKLTRIQRAYLPDSPVDELGQAELMQSHNDPASNPVTLFGSRFEDSSEKRNGGASRPNNPHKNSFSVATGALKQNPAEQRTEAEEAHEKESRTPGLSPRLSEDDPRAYLIHHRRDYVGAKASELTRTSLKIRRTKTMRLPLETIPRDAVVHDSIALLTNSLADLDILRANCEILSRTDAYTDTGRNAYVDWTADIRAVDEWERTLRKFITGLYDAQEGEDPSDVEIVLTRAIKMQFNADV